METIYIYSFLSVIVISLMSFVGAVTLALNEEKLRKYLFIFVSLALGALLGDAFIHLIPEAFEKFADTNLAALAVITGVFIFLTIEKVLHWHHHHEPDEAADHVKHPVGKMILVSDGLHNFTDGLIIGASYLAGIEIGIATTIAVILHEIPQEIGDFGVLIYSGYSAMKALWFNFLSALTAVLGVAIALAISDSAEVLALWILPVAAGGFIYIALADLIPALQKTRNAKLSFLQLFVAAAGVFAMLALAWLE